MRKVKYVLDSEKATIYSPVAPKKDSSHNLTIWKTNRPESALEKFHEQLAHYGNGAMRKEYADALIYRGTAEYNIVCRHKQQNNQRLLDGVPLATPKWQQNVPTFWDHSILHFINQLARSKGFLEPFKNYETPKANNGEVFLSDYCIEQTVRNNNNAGIRTNDDNQLCVYRLHNQYSHSTSTERSSIACSGRDATETNAAERATASSFERDTS